jgi:hypothetical protein
LLGVRDVLDSIGFTVPESKEDLFLHRSTLAFGHVPVPISLQIIFGEAYRLHQLLFVFELTHDLT